MNSLYIIENKPKKCLISEVLLTPISTRYFKKDNEPQYKSIEKEMLSEGKVYMIKPLNGDAGDIYIGKTKLDSITDRLKYHISDYYYWKQGKNNFVSSFILFEKYGVDECHILLLENVCCDTPTKLKEREDYYLSKYNCINQNKPKPSKSTKTKINGEPRIKKPRSEAQKEAFLKVKAKRAEMNKVKKEERENKKLMYEKYRESLKSDSNI
jgi:hypothetical protein